MLGSWRLFTTAKGVAMDDGVNEAASGQINQIGADFNNLG